MQTKICGLIQKTEYKATEISVIRVEIENTTWFYCLFSRESHSIGKENISRYSEHRKVRGINKIASILWMMEKAREFQKNIYFCFIDYAKAFTVWLTKNCGKFLKRGEYETTLPASWEICMQVRKQQLELYMEQQTGYRLGKEYLWRLNIVSLLI